MLKPNAAMAVINSAIDGEDFMVFRKARVERSLKVSSIIEVKPPIIRDILHHYYNTI